MSDVFAERTELRIKTLRLIQLLQKVVESDERGWLMDSETAKQVRAEIRQHREELANNRVA